MRGRIVTRDFSGREINPDDGSPVMPMESAGRALRAIVAELAEDMRQPAARAGFTVSMLSAALLARRLGFLPTLAVSLLAGVSVEHLYGLVEGIAESVTRAEIESAFTDAPRPV